MATLYGLVRFSDRQQGDGDSERRQGDWVRQVAREGGYELVPLEVRGISAFKGRHLRIGDLARFWEKVQAGEVAPGSVLAIERIDRLSRQEIDDARQVFEGLLRRGILIRTRAPDKLWDRGSLNNPLDLMMMIFEMVRANEESRAKSERICEAKGRHRLEARERRKRAPGGRPFWLQWEGEPGTREGRWVQVPELVKAAREMFRLAADGLPSAEIARHLLQRGVKGRSGQPLRTSSVRWILRSRVARGDYKPTIGSPIEGYYPAIISEEEWLRAQTGLTRRRCEGAANRNGEVSNLLGRLPRLRKTGERLVIQNVTARDRRTQYLIPEGREVGEKVGKTGERSCRYGPIEEAVLAMMAEMEGEATPQTADDVPVGNGAQDRLDEVEEQIREYRERVARAGREGGELYLDLLEDLYQRRRVLREEAAAERARLTRPRGTEHLVMRYLERQARMTPEERGRARRVLRGRLAEAIDRVYLTIWKLSRTGRRVEVEVWLAGGRRKVATIEYA